MSTHPMSSLTGTFIMCGPRRVTGLSFGLLVVLALSIVGCSDGLALRTGAPNASAGMAHGTVECRFIESPVVIDGTLDDEAWKTAAKIENFSMPWLRGDKKPSKGTRAKILWDRENLYIAADLDDADLYADITEHDAQIWDNDVFEVFLKPAADKPSYYEFQVSARNTQFDNFILRRSLAARFRRAHKFGIESAVKHRGTIDIWTDTDQGWSVEMRIPWSSFMHTGGRPAPGDEWRFALCRYDYDVNRDQPELSTCAPLSKESFHQTENYLPLKFVGPSSDTARPYGIPTIVPVTSSRMAGSPEPPLPYTVERAMPKASMSCPITVAHQPGSDRLIYVTEPRAYRPSTVLRMRDDATSYEPEVLIPADDSTVHYSITFHPKFAENGFVYIGSNGIKSPDGRVPKDEKKWTRITRYVIDPKPPYTFHQDSATVIIEWESDGHNGGDMAFGLDGMMYVGSGDGTSESDTDRVGQDLTSIRAKILRIDVDHPDDDVPGDGRHYSIPKDNPIFDQGSLIATVKGARLETYAYGLRQPWRIVIDKSTGQMWVGNQGQDLWEQIYLIERGANYGWSILEGTHPFNHGQQPGPTPFSKPVAEHPHAEARAMTGGLVYTGSGLPELRGAYLYADYSTGRIWGIRHDGTKVTWHELLADTNLQITAIGTDSRGEILICDHQAGDKGGFYRLVPTPPASQDGRPFPRRLSETGLFADVARHRMVDGVIPYQPVSPLWSDGTHKARFFALPAMKESSGRIVPAKIGVTSARGWNFPDGTVLVKSFAIDEVEGDPSTRRWIETRFMLKEQGEWAGYTYEWTDDQTDAVLVPDQGKDREFTIRTADLQKNADGFKKQQWHYPSRTECMVCHSRASNFVLGLCTVQLNSDYDYAAVLGEGHSTDNQLRALEHLGVLEVDWWGDAVADWYRLAEAERIGETDVKGRLTAKCASESGPNDTEEPKTAEEIRKEKEKEQERLKEQWIAQQTWVARHTVVADPKSRAVPQPRSSMLSRSPARTNRLVNPYDSSHPLEARARSYLHSNCSSCHVLNGGGNAQIDLEYMSAYDTKPLDAMKAIGVKPLHTTFGIPDAKLIAAGHPDLSVIYERISRRGPGQMPQLATAIVDEPAVEMIREWIESLGADPSKKADGRGHTIAVEATASLAHDGDRPSDR